MTHTDIAAPVVSLQPSSHVQDSHVFPFGKRTLDSILERKRFIAAFPWTNSDVQLNEIGEVSFPGVFVNFSNIMEKLSNFAFIRYDVEVELRIVGSPTTAGVLCVGYMPCAGVYDLNNFYHLPWVNPHHLDVGAASTLKLTIPFCHPNYAARLPFKNDTLLNAGRHSRLWILVEHPLRNLDNSTCAVNIEVYARMVNVRTGGDIVSNLNAPPALTVPQLTKEDASLYKEWLAIRNAKTQSAEANSRLSMGSPGPGETVNKIGRMIGDIVGAASTAVTGGALGARPTTSRPPKPSMLDIGFGTIGSSRPASHDVDNLSTEYLTPAIPASRMGDFKSYNTLNDVAVMPGLIANFDVTTASTTQTILLSIPITPCFMPEANGRAYPTPAGWVAIHHTHWRGSMKYMIKYSGPQTLACRIGWVWYPVSSLIPTTNILSNIGDTLSGIIDCTGTGMSTITIPWLQTTPVLPSKVQTLTSVDDFYNNGYLVFYVVNPPVSPSTTAPALHITVWSAVENDTQWVNSCLPMQTNLTSVATQSVGDTVQVFNVPVPNTINGYTDEVLIWEDGSEADAETQSLSDIFSKPFPCPDDTNIAGYPATAITNTVVSMSDIMQRPISYGNGGTTGQRIPITHPLAPITSAPNPGLSTSFGRIFRFWRGSRIWRHITPNAQPTMFVDDKLYQSEGGSQLIRSNALGAATSGLIIPWNCLTGDYAWNALNPYLPDSSWSPHFAAGARYAIGSFPSPINEWLAFGDDFQVGGLSPPPEIDYDT